MAELDRVLSEAQETHLLMQQAAKSIRVRNAGVFLLPWRAAFMNA